MSELEKKPSFVTGGSRGVGAAPLEIKLIHCPIDFSEFSERAYQHAVSLAEHYQASLVAQHVVELWRHPSASFAATGGLYEEFRQVLRETGEDHLQQFANSHTHDKIQAEFVVHEGSAPDAILSFAEAQKADLIVMGTHGRRGFDHLMLGSVTDRVMRRAPCPVLAVRNLPHDAAAGSKEQQYTHHLSRILFCADFSKNSERALNYALSGAAEYDAEVTMLHVLEDVPSLTKTEDALAEATEQLDKLISPDVRKTCKVKTVVRIGKPYREIVQFAQEAQSDLVAMGVRGRGALDRAVFGSTTYRVMQLGSCPVLAVHV